uniref:Macroglobulin domain-containing protein n=2 Tax=Plectus sambesii TaxID=2011161 RepID=A0A914VER2_9BILA
MVEKKMDYYLIAVLIAACLLCSSAQNSATTTEIRKPIVVLPPCLRWGITNEIYVTTIRTDRPIVDFEIIVTQEDGNVIFRNRVIGKLAGTPVPIQFLVPTGTISTRYKITIEADGHAPFMTEIPGGPNLRLIHVQTDKQFYRAGETVEVRALPLTEEGSIYQGAIDFSLMNADGFELRTQTLRATNRFIPMKFDLPEHLHFGEWKIVARPAGFRAPDLSFDATFKVTDYDLPNFRVILVANDETVDQTGTKIAVNIFAYYSFGAPVNGTVSISCIKDSSGSALVLTSSNDATVMSNYFDCERRAKLALIWKSTVA